MHAFEKTSLWVNSFKNPQFASERKASQFLKQRLLDVRERAANLVSLIRADLPDFTVHDISHLDALWETGSLIAGKKYSLNPAEAFVFGCAVLLHDAAMSLAAYPNGISEVKQTPEWQDAITGHLQAQRIDASTTTADVPPEIAKAALTDALRTLHAKQAARLPLIKWPAKDGSSEYLIQDSDLRQYYGDIIGKIAESHWWSPEELRSRLPRRINAGPSVPSEWHFDPLKIGFIREV